MHNPVTITAGSRNKVAENISHACYMVKEKDRYVALKRMIDYIPDIFGLIFCRTRLETQAVAEKLMKDGYSAEALHGELSQIQRDNVMQKFRDKSIQLLVATDVDYRPAHCNYPIRSFLVSGQSDQRSRKLNPRFGLCK